MCVVNVEIGNEMSGSALGGSADQVECYHHNCLRSNKIKDKKSSIILLNSPVGS